MADSSIIIDKFLGLNTDSSGLNIEVGELASMKNIKITENYKMKKRNGYTEYLSAGSGGKVQGMWYGKLGASNKFVYARNGKAYDVVFANEALTRIGGKTLLTNGDFSNGTNNWTYGVTVTMTVSSNVATILASQQNDVVFQSAFSGAGSTDIVYFCAKVKTTSNQVCINHGGLTVPPGLVDFADGTNNWEFLSAYGQRNPASVNVGILDTRTSGWNSFQVKEVYAINLTQIFGAGNEPSKAELDAVFNGTNTKNFAFDIGSLTNAKTYFFAFNDKLYIQNGAEYKSWNGTGSIADVEGYIPKVAIATPPTGGGTPFEDINVLTGKKRQTFNGNNTATVFTLAEKAITSVDKVYVGGVLKTVTTHYTVDTTNGTVTFTGGNTPPSGTDNVEIYWTKGSGTRATVTANKQSVLYGGANDSRIFMYGVGNKLIYSALADGVPSAEYFPENNFLLVGSDETAITHLSKQYDRLIVHKERDTFYSTYNFDATNGASFPTFPLNDSIGNIAFGQGQNILNNPFIITSNGVFQFVATNVRDEKNAVFTSQRVQDELDTLDLATAITFDYEKEYEYWLVVGKKCYIYNYKKDVWYLYELYDTPSCFLEVNGVAYFGTSTGKVMRFGDVLTDNGQTIQARFETGFLNFGANYIRKFLNFAWVGLEPSGRSKCMLSWQSDNAISDDYTIEYNLIDFGNVNFNDFSLNTISSPKPFRLKFKAKKYSFLKIIGENNETTYGMTLLNISMPVVYGGQSK